MSEDWAPIGLLKLAGYVPLTRHGFALPCFASDYGANTWYVAKATISGDHSASLAGFDPFPMTSIVRFPTVERTASVGDRWCDVFLWKERPYVGTPTEIWEATRDLHAELAREAPLSLLDLARFSQPDECAALSRRAYRFLLDRFGVIKAKTWLCDTYLRQGMLIVLKRMAYAHEIDVDLDVIIGTEIKMERKSATLLLPREISTALTNDKRSIILGRFDELARPFSLATSVVAAKRSPKPVPPLIEPADDEISDAPAGPPGTLTSVTKIEVDDGGLDSDISAGPNNRAAQVYEAIFARDPLLLDDENQAAFGSALLDPGLGASALRIEMISLADASARARLSRARPPAPPAPPPPELAARYANARIRRTALTPVDREILRRFSFVCNPERTQARLAGKFPYVDEAKREKRRGSTDGQRLRIAAVGYRVKMSRLANMAYLDDDLCPVDVAADGDTLAQFGSLHRSDSHKEERWRKTIEEHIATSLQRGSDIVLLPEFALPPSESEERLFALVAETSRKNQFVFAGSRHEGSRNRGLILSSEDGQVTKPWWHYKLTSSRHLGESIIGATGPNFPAYQLDVGNTATTFDILVAIGSDINDRGLFLSLVQQSVYASSSYRPRIILVPAFDPSAGFRKIVRDLSFVARCPVVYANGLHGDAGMFVCGFSVSDLSERNKLERMISQQTHELRSLIVDRSRELRARFELVGEQVTLSSPVDLRRKMLTLQNLQASLNYLVSTGAMDNMVTVERCAQCSANSHAHDDYLCKTDILYYDIDLDLIAALSQFRRDYFVDDSFLPSQFRQVELDRSVQEMNVTSRGD